MSTETSKANLRRKHDPLFIKKVFVGHGIDIGCGSDSLKPCKDFPGILSIQEFEINNGNANYISKWETGEFDFVYSSHCLEHLLDPYRALAEWAKLVKRGGYLCVVVPDEDLFEQGTFPSRFNRQHIFSYTIEKVRSWSQSSINMADLVKSVLPKWDVLKMSIEDTGYVYSRMKRSGTDQTKEGAETNIEVVLCKS